MPRNLNRVLSTIILLTPLLLALLGALLGIHVSGRDDLNYITELQTRPYFVAAPDQLSWAALKALGEVIPDPVLALRLAGFLFCFGTCFVLLSKRAGESTIAYFAISIAPLYWDLYFNQVRLALAIMIFLLLLVRSRPILAPLGGALAHISALVFIFPPAIIIAPFGLSAIYFLNRHSFEAVRYAAYLDADYLSMPWYFGWELIGLALLLAFEKKGGRAIAVIVYAVAVRLLAEGLSVDVARRLLELGLFIYSPVIFYLRTRSAPTQLMLAFYSMLGLLSLYASLAGGVVSIGGGR